MKKAKIFLTALTVLSVVGGALAFKAKDLHRFAFCNKTLGICTLSSFLTTETTFEGIVKKNYDEYGKPCVIENGVLTCTTLVTTAP